MTSNDAAHFVSVDLEPSSGKNSKGSETRGKAKDTTWSGLLKAILNIIIVVILLYTFVCSIDLMSSGLKLMMGKTANNIFESSFFRNPIAALMVGVMGTVIMQSSSTSTAIIVTLVSTKSLKVKQAIPMVMGANIGTSVTNTLVAMGQIENKEEFRRAFAGATVHDMFNWLTVIVLLPLEVCTGYLAFLSGLMVQNIPDSSTGKGESVKIPGLNLLTDPLTDLIIQINSSAVSHVNAANGNSSFTENYPILPKNCPTKSNPDAPCEALFNLIGWSNTVTALAVLALSVCMLCVCLILLVKVLRSVFSGYFNDIITKTVNATLPAPFGWLTGYLGVLVGAVLTMIVQSSSIFTSTLTPLVGLGVIELETIFPMTLGSNLGTTITGIMAAFANDNLKYALQIALCHLLFNLSGFILWYPIPHTRKVPLQLARMLGKTTSNYRWFAVAYVIVMFFIAPAGIFALSWAGPIPLYIVFSLFGFSLSIILALNLAQKNPKLKPLLPQRMQTWEFLPLCLRSLEPYDRVLKSLTLKCRKRNENDQNQFLPLTTNS